ncbi:hypothetical protein V1509DRAFT_643281 [Lipomyces kononenkoae]
MCLYVERRTCFLVVEKAENKGWHIHTEKIPMPSNEDLYSVPLLSSKAIVSMDASHSVCTNEHGRKMFLANILGRDCVTGSGFRLLSCGPIQKLPLIRFLEYISHTLEYSPEIVLMDCSEVERGAIDFAELLYQRLLDAYTTSKDGNAISRCLSRPILSQGPVGVCRVLHWVFYVESMMASVKGRMLARMNWDKQIEDKVKGDPLLRKQIKSIDHLSVAKKFLPTMPRLTPRPSLIADPRLYELDNEVREFIEEVNEENTPDIPVEKLMRSSVTCLMTRPIYSS